MDFSEILALGIPAIVALMVIASIVHAWFAVRKPAQDAFHLFRPGVIIVCVLHLVIAVGVYRLLNSGGWLTHEYHRNDPDDINLVLAIFEAFCAATVVALAVARRKFFYKLLVDLLIIQFIFVGGCLILLSIFMLTWHPKMF